MFVSHMELLNVLSLLSIFAYFCSRYYGRWLLAASLRGHSTARTWTMMLLHKDLVLITVFRNVYDGCGYSSLFLAILWSLATTTLPRCLWSPTPSCRCLVIIAVHWGQLVFWKTCFLYVIIAIWWVVRCILPDGK
jgi:hypothetical protein